MGANYATIMKFFQPKQIPTKANRHHWLYVHILHFLNIQTVAADKLKHNLYLMNKMKAFFTQMLIVITSSRLLRKIQFFSMGNKLCT